jgi:hypothetical protein
MGLDVHRCRMNLMSVRPSWKVGPSHRPRLDLWRRMLSSLISEILIRNERFGHVADRRFDGQDAFSASAVRAAGEL